MNEYGNTRLTLIQKIKNRYDEGSWQEFVEIYERYIYSIIRQLGLSADESEEMTQNIMIKLWKKLPDYDYDPQRARFRTWLSRVVKNAVFSFKREQGKIPASTSIEEYSIKKGAEIDSIINDEWEIYVSNIAMERIRDFFTGNAIKVFEMSLQGVAPSEISATLKIGENSVYKLKNRVKERLVREIKFLREELD